MEHTARPANTFVNHETVKYWLSTLTNRCASIEPQQIFFFPSSLIRFQQESNYIVFIGFSVHLHLHGTINKIPRRHDKNYIKVFNILFLLFSFHFHGYLMCGGTRDCFYLLAIIFIHILKCVCFVSFVAFLVCNRIECVLFCILRFSSFTWMNLFFFYNWTVASSHLRCSAISVSM